MAERSIRAEDTLQCMRECDCLLVSVVPVLTWFGSIIGLGLGKDTEKKSQRCINQRQNGGHHNLQASHDDDNTRRELAVVCIYYMAMDSSDS